MGEARTVLPWQVDHRGDTGDTLSLAVSHRLRRRLYVATALIVSDAIVGVVAMKTTELFIAPPFVTGVMTIPLLISAYLVQGLYTGCGPGPCERLRLRAHGIALFAGLGVLINAVLGEPERLVAVLVCIMLLAALGYYAETSIRVFLIRWGLWGGATAIVAGRARSEAIAKQLLDQPDLGLLPVGYVQLRPEAVSDPAKPILPYMGTVADLPRIARQVDLIVFGSTADAAALAPNFRQRLPVRQLALVGEARNVQSLWVQTRTLGESIGIELRCGSYFHYSQWVKRAMDLLIAVPACVLTLPVIALSALAIKIVDPGPAFYFQNRVGIDGKIVPVCKLRTMYCDAERRLEEHLARDPGAMAEWHRFFKLTNDPRILPLVGKIIRRASLDELPQLWHVVSGAMSLVGPRPFPTYHISSFDVEFQQIRASVLPGLSGLWQVSARSSGDIDIQRAQDLFYIVNWSVWLDLYILLETPIAVMTGRGAR